MAKPSRSKLWFLVHSWLAMPIWVLMFFVCATGTIAVISQEIVWLIHPAVRAEAPGPDSVRLSYQALVDAIGAQDPRAVVQGLSWPEESHFALTASVSYPGGTSTQLYVNPYSGAIQGPALDFDLRKFMRALHGWLLVPFGHGFSWGWYLVSALAIPMLASLVTGLVVYKRFWRAYFQKPRLRTGQGSRIFWGDFHRLSGLWSIWFVLLISISALWFLIQAVLADTHTTVSTEGVPTIIARANVPVAEGEGAPRISLNQIVARAQQALPGLDAQHVFLGGNAFDPVTILGRGAYPLMFESAQVNPYDGNVLRTRTLGDRSALEFFTESMRPLHTGDFGGFWLKMVWFFFGLLLTMMALSGMLIWSRRTAQETAKALKQALAKARGAGRWKFHLSALVLILPLIYLASYFKDMAMDRGEGGLGQRVIGPVQVGSWTLEFAEWEDEPPETEPAGTFKLFTMALCEGCEREIRAVFIHTGRPRSLRTAGALFSGGPHRSFAEVLIPAGTQPGAQFWITVEGWDGATHSATLPIAQASPATAQWLTKTNGMTP